MIPRIKALIFEAPKELDKIRDENLTVPVVFKTWVLVLSAIPAVVHLLNGFRYGGSRGLQWGLIGFVTSFVATAGSTFLWAWVIDFFAPKFGGKSDFARAFNVAAFSATPCLVASAFGIIPLLGILSLAGLVWSIWLLRLALPRFMGASEEQAVPYTVVVIVLSIIVSAVLFSVSGFLSGGYYAGMRGY